MIDWTDEQKEDTLPVLEEIKSELAFIKWQFPEVVYLVKTNGSEEGGAAYTRSNGIVLPGRRGGGRSKGLITHELFHVLSRHNPELRDKIYAVIGFKKCSCCHLFLPGQVSCFVSSLTMRSACSSRRVCIVAWLAELLASTFDSSVFVL